MGVNASVDHKIPKGRGGKNDSENLQFVFTFGNIDVNFMKGKMTDAEFREVIKVIYNNLFGGKS